MKIENIYIENLIEKFFEGKTSNEEEKKLWIYFSSENIPDHLKQHKEFFLYYSNDFMTEIKEIKKPLMTSKSKRKRVKMITIAASAVAAILVFAIIFPFVKPSDDRFNPYEGSYILMNGQKTYNIESIKQQEKEIREMIAIREKEYREIYSQSESKKSELQSIMNVENK